MTRADDVVTLYAVLSWEEEEDGRRVETLPREVARMSREDWLTGQEIPRQSGLEWGRVYAPAYEVVDWPPHSPLRPDHGPRLILLGEK